MQLVHVLHPLEHAEHVPVQDEHEEHPLHPEQVVLHCVWQRPEQDAAQPGELVVVVILDRSLTTFVSLSLSKAVGITSPTAAVGSPLIGLTAFSG